MDIFNQFPATAKNPNGFCREPIPEITKYMSYSRIKTMADSMAHFEKRYIRGIKPEDTPEKKFGRLCHKMLLEPDMFRANYVIDPEKEDHSNLIETVPELKAELLKHMKIPSKAKREDIENSLIKVNPHFRSRIWRFILQDHVNNLSDESVQVTKKEADLILSMIEAIDNKVIKTKRARDLLIDGQGEICAYWEDSEFGVTWFARLDYLRVFQLTTDEWLFWISDLKTTKNGSYDGFKKEIALWGYHFQNYIYRRMVHGITGMRVNMTTIAVEKVDPIGVGVYEPEVRSDENAAWEIRRLLEKWRWCQEVGRYPKYEEKIIPQGPPSWYYWNTEQKADMEEES